MAYSLVHVDVVHVKGIDSECTSASCTKALPRGPSCAITAASFAGGVGSDVTTDAGVSVVAALACTGRTAERRLQLEKPIRSLKGCTADGRALRRVLEACMRAVIGSCIELLKRKSQRC